MLAGHTYPVMPMPHRREPWPAGVKHWSGEMLPLPAVVIVPPLESHNLHRLRLQPSEYCGLGPRACATKQCGLPLACGRVRGAYARMRAYCRTQAG